MWWDLLVLNYTEFLKQEKLISQQFFYILQQMKDQLILYNQEANERLS